MFHPSEVIITTAGSNDDDEDDTKISSPMNHASSSTAINSTTIHNDDGLLYTNISSQTSAKPHSLSPIPTRKRAKTWSSSSGVVSKTKQFFRKNSVNNALRHSGTHSNAAGTNATSSDLNYDNSSSSDDSYSVGRGGSSGDLDRISSSRTMKINTTSTANNNNNSNRTSQTNDYDNDADREDYGNEYLLNQHAAGYPHNISPLPKSQKSLKQATTPDQYPNAKTNIFSMPSMDSNESYDETTYIEKPLVNHNDQQHQHHQVIDKITFPIPLSKSSSSNGSALNHERDGDYQNTHNIDAFLSTDKMNQYSPNFNHVAAFSKEETMLTEDTEDYHGNQRSLYAVDNDEVHYINNNYKNEGHDEEHIHIFDSLSPRSSSSIKHIGNHHHKMQYQQKTSSVLTSEYDANENVESYNNYSPPRPKNRKLRHRKGRIEKYIESFCSKYCWFCPSIPRPGWSRVSSAVVRYAPCFFCADKLETNATDRMLLTRLNVLCAIFSLAQFAVGVFILIVFLSESVVDRGVDDNDNFVGEALTPNLWMMGGCLLILALVGLFIFCTMIITIPKIKRVNLDAAIRFMWILYWVLPLQILFVIALFDYHKVTDVWIKHWWSAPSMAWFREFCCEKGTANTKCAVPVSGGENFTDSTDWCIANYNATDCDEIRDAATNVMESRSYFFIYTNSILGAVLIILLLLSLGLLEGIISAPIVQRSKESNISLWLTVPIVGCFGGGAALSYTPQSLISNDPGIQWIGLCYLVTGATFTISALLGWFISAKSVMNLRDKTHKMIAVYIFIIMMIITIFAVASIFAFSLVYTLNFVNVSDESRGKIACYIDAANSCTCCEEDQLQLDDGTCGLENQKRMCPEWTNQDVTRIIQTQLKQSATLAAIFFLYAFSALRFGFSLRASVSRYEIDYV